MEMRVSTEYSIEQTGATSGTGTAYPSGAHEFTPSLECGSCFRSLVLCVRVL